MLSFIFSRQEILNKLLSYNETGYDSSIAPDFELGKHSFYHQVSSNKEKRTTMLFICRQVTLPAMSACYLLR